MRYQPVPPLARRWLAALLSLLLGLGPLATPAYAGLTPLADEPINIKNQAKPNIILTVDDSTSMLYDFLPDYVVGSKFCRDATGASMAFCGYSGSPANAGPGGQYVSPQYIWEQPAVATLSTIAAPFPAYATGAGAVPASFSPQLFSNSGPGAGCNLTPTFPNPPSCTGGIDPGALPGMSIYPVASGSPKAGLPYEYWLLWPAPVHNSALNHMYYNPRLTYDPPAYPDASSYPQMDATNTTNWTKVRADPFTTSDPLDCSSEPCVDLTANVIVGQWCNSDWTQGNDDSGLPFVTNPGHCRTNGLVAAASAGAPIAIGDYMYPWAPAGITPNDATTKVDTSVVTISPPTNAAVKAAWTGAQDAKYFYENDNVLWCDITSPDWPQTGPTVPQTCTNKVTPQTCTPNPVQPTCGGAVNGACGGVVAAGSCSATTTGDCSGYLAGGQCTGWAAGGTCTGWVANGKCTGFAANGQCTGFIAGQCSATANGTCGGFSNGVCGGFSNGVCSGGVAAACANPPTCGGAAAAACNGVTKEACVAGTAAACNGLVPQTCGAPTPIACNAVPQTCNGGGAQTCANIVEIPPDPSTCTSAWVPLGCNINPDPEGTCVYTTTCPPPTFAGKCSIQTTKVCTADTDCPFINGVCSVAGNSCTSNTDCNLKRCQSTTTDCTSNPAICGNVPGSGRCSATNAACTVNSDCPSQGTCNYQTTGGVANGACTTAADCKAFPNHCQTTTATTCPTLGANSASCPVVPNSGACNYKNTGGTNLGPCTTAANCQAKPNVCNNPANQACPGGVSNCTQGTCNYKTTGGVANGPCVVVGDCQAKPNTCANAGATFGTVCATAAACTDSGTCTNAGATNGTACTTAAACTDAGSCTTGNVGGACTVNGVTAQCALANGVCISGDPAKNGQPCTTGTAATACQKPGACSTGSVGTPCFTGSASDVTCKKAGACSTGNIGAVCNSSSNNDVACKVTGACTTGNVGAACNSNSGNDVACTKAGACTTGFIGAVCNSNSSNDASCAKPGACTSGNVGASCTAPNGPTAQCALVTGVCSGGANNGASCTVANQGTTCAGAPGHCTAGQPNTASCNVASDCNVGSVCSNSAANGAACSAASDCTPLNGSCSFDSSIACTTNAQCSNLVGTCSITGASCTADNQCPNQPGPTNPLLGVRCDTGGVSGNPLTTLLADANGLGKACRRNNHAYASDGTTASQTNYPSGKFTTPVTGEITAGLGCHATDRYATVPRHYWKTEVEWCDKSVSTGGDKWLGYGTSTGGSCQVFKDATHVFPRFYEFGVVAPPGTIDNVNQAAFARIDLVSTTTFQHDWTDDSGTAQTITRTFAEEMTNYANWFAYYRTRLLAVKTVTSLAFLGKTAGTLNLDDQYRIGFHTMFSYGTSFVNIDDFDATQKTAWAKQLMDLKVPLGQETPTLNTVSRIGDYYLNGTSALLPGSTDPIVLSCQKNWHMFFTDGFTNQNSLPTTTVGDMDDVLPGTLPVGGTAVAITGLTPGAAWPPPFREDTSGSNAVGNSASDYVTNYWVTNLRPAMPENVATSARDPASWPHQNFAAMSLGTEGILPSGNQSNVEAQLTAGTLQWPKPQPTVYKPDQSGVDDLWHAAINGRGRFVNAQSADELKLGMGQILQDVVNQAGARTGASFQSTSISATANFIYRTSFQPGWGSSLRKVQIDPVTGAEIAVAWDASAQLATQLTVVPGVKDTPWFTDRIVVTIDETGKAVPFLDASIGSNQLDSLAPGKTPRATAILAFLRGDRSREGTKVGQFRVRIGGLLGDIVDSQPVYVGAPGAPYLEANDPGYTLNFKDAAAFKTRPARIYVGANDGMLHAFDDATGNEAWAFVPADLYRPDQTGLGALSYQDGALPPFQHHFYVDATPRITDVNFGGGDSDWHTILVGGLGKGGKSYYALDISQPNDITSEAEAAKRVLWEFTDADMGYSYGRAIVAKTHAFSGQWLVIVTSGYNNASGLGKVFFLRASDGKLLKTLSTGAGTATTPSGLTHIAAYEKDFRNQVVEQIYGGDLLGNFWRFDVSDSDDSTWGAAEKIANLTDTGGNPQPVTIPPQIEIDIANGIDRWVFIGTGRLLDDLDLTTPAIANQIQTMYAFRDGTAAAPIAPWPATLAPRTDMSAVTDAAGLAAKPDKGWYDDLPLGQRIVVPVQAALSVIAYVGTSPQTDPCLTGQPATLYAREYGRGNSLLTDDTGATIEGFFQAEGIVGIELVVLSGGSTDSGAGGFPDLRIAITAGTPGKATGFPKPKAPDFAQKHRMSWRLLGQ